VLGAARAGSGKPAGAVATDYPLHLAVATRGVAFVYGVALTRERRAERTPAGADGLRF
jgi:hypothetical protein